MRRYSCWILIDILWCWHRIKCVRISFLRLMWQQFMAECSYISDDGSVACGSAAPAQPSEQLTHHLSHFAINLVLGLFSSAYGRATMHF